MNKQEQFFNEISNDPAVTKMADFFNKNKESISDLSSDYIKTLELLEAVKYDEWTYEFISGKIQALWEFYNNTIKETPIRINNMTVAWNTIFACYLGCVVEGREVNKDDIKKFCDEINELERLGVITDYALIDCIYGLPLSTGVQPIGVNETVDLGPGPRTCLFFYSFNNLHNMNIKLLKRVSPYFINEGQLPEVIYK